MESAKGSSPFGSTMSNRWRKMIRSAKGALVLDQSADFFSDLTWTCHVCEDERPDENIAVYSRKVTRNGVTFQENIRYCSDRPECAKGARTKTFLS